MSQAGENQLKGGVVTEIHPSFLLGDSPSPLDITTHVNHADFAQTGAGLGYHEMVASRAFNSVAQRVARGVILSDPDVQDARFPYTAYRDAHPEAYRALTGTKRPDIRPHVILASSAVNLIYWKLVEQHAADRTRAYQPRYFNVIEALLVEKDALERPS